MTSVLDKIVAAKREEIAASKRARGEAELRRAAESAPAVRNFFAPLAAGGPIRLIAEVKKASPSAGLIRADFQPVEIARAYERHGATCLSVLTDGPYFQGSLDDLRTVRGTPCC
jgi:indole-3-glycerol phosphate synthase